MSEQKLPSGDPSLEQRVDRIEARLSHVEGAQLALIHSFDEMRAENAVQFAEIRKALASLIEDNHILVELVRSLQPPRG